MVSDQTRMALMQMGRNAHGGKEPGKKKPLTMEKALELLKAEYEKAQLLDFVRNPIAYALHKVWRMVDQQGG